MATTDRIEPKPARPVRLPALALGATLALLTAFGAWRFSSVQLSGQEPENAATLQAAFEEATGVQLVRIAVTAGGGMLDLRYRVLDPDKAIVVYNKQKTATIIAAHG